MRRPLSQAKGVLAVLVLVTVWWWTASGATGTGRAARFGYGGGTTPVPTISPIPSATPVPTLPLEPPPPTPLERAATASSVVVSFVSTVSGIVTVATTATAVPGGLSSLLQAFFPFVGVRRTPPRWGRVVEDESNLPVPKAVVAVLDAAGKPRQTAVTRPDGTFGVLLPRGTYSLLVRADGYQFAARPRRVAVFPEERLYTGGVLAVKQEDSVPLVVLALKPLRPKARRLALLGWSVRLKVLQARAALPILLAGATLNTVLLVREPRPLLVAFEVLYVILLALELAIGRLVQRTLGRVRDALRGVSVPLAIVRLVDLATNHVVTTAVTSPQGHFLLLPPRGGQFRLDVTHAAYQPFTRSDVRSIAGGVHALRLSVPLTPRPAAPAPQSPEGGVGPAPTRPPT